MPIVNPRAQGGNEFPELERNRLSVDQFASQVGHSIWLSAKEFDGPAPAVYQSAVSGTPSHWLLQGHPGGLGSGPDSIVYAYVRVPRWWIRGHVEALIHLQWTDSITSSTFQFGYARCEHLTAIPGMKWESATVSAPTAAVLYVYKPKDALDTDYGTAGFATDEINPAPLGLYDMMATEPNVPPDHKSLVVAFRHDSDDDVGSGGDIQFLGMELIYIPHQLTVGDAVYEDYYRDDTRLASF